MGTHQEMEMYRSQALSSDKLQLKKETLQSQLINIRGELSQASSVRAFIGCVSILFRPEGYYFVEITKQRKTKSKP